MKEGELLDRREEKIKSFKKAKSRYEDVSSENKSANLYNQALASKAIANYSLLMEEYEDALDWFEKSAEIYLENYNAITSGNFSEYSTARSLPKMLIRSFNCAILSGEESLITRILKAVQDMPETIEMEIGDELEKVDVDKNSFHHCKAIYYLEKETKDNTLEKIERIEPDYYRINQVKCIEGIAEGNIDRIHSGFLGIINKKKGNIPKNHPSHLDEISDDLISMQALAIRHNIEIETDQKYSNKEFLERLSR